MSPHVAPDELLALLRERRSVRRFRDEPLGDDVIEALIEAATLAPSASNKQPWRFFVVTSRAVIARMADAVRAETKRIEDSIAGDSAAAFRAYGDYFTRFEGAPAVIVPICRGLSLLGNLVGPELDPASRARILAMETSSGLIGTSLALENLLLMAHAMGLGASGMTGPLIAEHALRELLEIPPSWSIVALVPVGWPDETPRPTDRKPAEKVTRWIR